MAGSFDTPQINDDTSTDGVADVITVDIYGDIAKSFQTDVSETSPKNHSNHKTWIVV